MGDIWLKILDTIMRFGNVKKSQHSSDQREVVNLISVITGENVDAIDWKPYFLFTKEELQNYLPQVLTKNPIPNVEYTYGQRLRDHDGIDQIRSIIEDLKKTPYSRRAVVVTWKVAKDHNNPHAPCLDLIQCLVQNNKGGFDVICARQGVSLIEHAFDLGAELQKAEIALKQGMTYAQDQFLKFDR